MSRLHSQNHGILDAEANAIDRHSFQRDSEQSVYGKASSDFSFQEAPAPAAAPADAAGAELAGGGTHNASWLASAAA